jgi:hypothetical protein
MSQTNRLLHNLRRFASCGEIAACHSCWRYSAAERPRHEMKMFCRLEVKQRLMEAISALAANEKIHAAAFW